jgi:membrane AbrB-like protein
MRKPLAPLLGGLSLLYAARIAGIPGGAFIGAISGGALVRILYARSEQPPARLQNFARLVLGLAIGVQVNRQAVDAAVSSGIPVMCMVGSLIVFSLIFAWILTRLTGMDLVTSLCGASPGAASAMIILAEDLGGDSPVVAVIHSIKILLIAAFMPVLAGLFPAGAAEALPPAGGVSGELWIYYGKLLFLVGAGFLVGKLMRKGGFPTAEVLAGLLVAAVCNPLFLHIEEFPPLWQLFSVWIVGTAIGAQMNRDSLRAIKKYAFACTVLVLALASLGLLLGWILYKTTHMGILTALIGTCPTGMDAMVILAAEMHTNVPLVAAMHSARVIIVMIIVPLLIRRAAGSGSKTG